MSDQKQYYNNTQPGETSLESRTGAKVVITALKNATSPSEEIELSDQSEDTALEQWKLLYPKFPVFSWKKGIIKSLVQALCRVAFSPKAIFPLMIMLKALGNNIVDSVEDVRTFMTKFRLLVNNIVGKIFSLFVKELYKIISRDIKTRRIINHGRCVFIT